MSYQGRITEALHDVLDDVLPDGQVVDWKIRSAVSEAVVRLALPIFEREVRMQGHRQALDALTKLVLERLSTLERENP